jgi:hypothetical protein
VFSAYLAQANKYGPNGMGLVGPGHLCIP